ncbi:MAG: 50S ribosomal protein L1 [Candidatus Doudnabacteria bacterium]|nr:50S ribosomal protein L1 [Candidatus Doudnabacteria bacterium]
MGKRFDTGKKEIDVNKEYSIEEALELAKKTGTTKFAGNIEVHAKLGIDPKKTEQTVRGTVSFPHGTGRTKRVAIFAGPEGEELIKKIKETGRTDFDVAVAEPAIMPKLAQIAKILGPKGLMPNPKTGNVTVDVEKAVKEYSSGKTEFKNDESGNVHVAIGKTNFETEKLAANFKAFMEALQGAKGTGMKKEFIQKLALHATMGPAIRVKI